MIFAVIETGLEGDVFAHGYLNTRAEAAHYINDWICDLTSAELEDLITASSGIVDRGLAGTIHILALTSLTEDDEDDEPGWELAFDI
jgi:hypothetical protein